MCVKRVCHSVKTVWYDNFWPRCPFAGYPSCFPYILRVENRMVLFRFVVGKPFYRYGIKTHYSIYILRYSCRYANPFQRKLVYSCSYDTKAKYTRKRWVLPTNDWKQNYDHFFAAFARGLSVRNVPILFNDDVDHTQGYLPCGLEPGLSTPWSPDLEKTRFEFSFAIFSMVFHRIGEYFGHEIRIDPKKLKTTEIGLGSSAKVGEKFEKLRQNGSLRLFCLVAFRSFVSSTRFRPSFDRRSIRGWLKLVWTVTQASPNITQERSIFRKIVGKTKFSVPCRYPHRLSRKILFQAIVNWHSIALVHWKRT